MRVACFRRGIVKHPKLKFKPVLGQPLVEFVEGNRNRQLGFAWSSSIAQGHLIVLHVGQGDVEVVGRLVLCHSVDQKEHPRHLIPPALELGDTGRQVPRCVPKLPRGWIERGVIEQGNRS